MWGILLAASLVLLADSLAKYARGDGSQCEVGLNLLGVIPGGRLVTAWADSPASLESVARGLAAGSRGLTPARAGLTRAARSLRAGMGRRMAVGTSHPLWL